ncbi:MAG: efflux RND transporter permease subunit, partial [Bacillota bacterium]
MNLSAPFIHRPVMTTVVMAALLVFGMFAYTRLPVSELPSVDFPTINVNANLPGANPENMASSVATPLERQFSTIAGVTSMNSTNTTGNTNITLQFDLSRNIDAAAQDVQTAISQSIRQLPANMPTPPTLRKVNPADYGIIYLALTSRSIPLTQLDEYAETRVAEELSQINGVAQVLVFGSYQYATRIYINPYALSARGLSLGQVSGAIQTNNTNLPSGTLYGSAHTYTVKTNGQLMNAAAYNHMIVAYQNGAPVHLSDIGYALDGIQEDKQLTTYSNADDKDGKLRPAVVLAVKRQPGANTVAVTQAVKALLPELIRQAPGDTVVHVLYNRADFIQGSIGDVRNTLLIAIVLVVGVIFMFLRNLRATLISALALPTSIVGTFAVMQLAGFSLDNLSLMALTLAVGFVVDDAIVMLENIVRHLEMGKRPLQAALDGAAEVGFTILSMSLSLAMVFVPLMFMGGIIGRLFREFAVTIAAATLVSCFVSLTLTPMLCSRMLKSKGEEQHGRLFNATERAFQATLRAYERSLSWLMEHRPVTLVFSAAILVLTAVLFTLVPKGLFPPDDTGALSGSAEAAQGTSYAEMLRYKELVVRRLQGDTNIASFTASVGGFGGGSNQVQLNVTLKPQGQRPPADAMVQELTRRTNGIPGLQTVFQNPPAIRIGGRGSRTLYQFTLRANDIGVLYREAANFLRRMQADPMLSGVTSDLLNRAPIVTVHIDRPRAASLGVTPNAIENALANAYNQQQISTIYTPSNEYWVVMETVPRAQTDVTALSNFYITG